jgi:hypothetical protein
MRLGPTFAATTLAIALMGSAWADERNFLRTDGNQIVDQTGTPIRISGVVWMGMESKDLAPIGAASA